MFYYAESGLKHPAPLQGGIATQLLPSAGVRSTDYNLVFGMQMKIVIATCNIKEDLEKVLSILHQAGPDKDNDSFIRWHDNVFGPSETSDKLEIDHRFPGESGIKENIPFILDEASHNNLLLADSRCLWLLDFWAEKFPEANFLLFFTRAVSMLTYACQHELEPQQALADWQAASRQLLQFQRRNRRRTILLDAEAAIRQPQALLDICQRIGLVLQALPQESAPDTERVETLGHYLAQHIVANQPEVQSLQVELEASAQPLGDVFPLEMQPFELLKIQSQQLAEQRKLQQQLCDTTKKQQIAEHALNEKIAQQTGMQERIDQLTQDRDEQAKLNAELHTKLEKLQQTRKTEEAILKNISSENELLTLQLHQVQEELEGVFLQNQQLEQQTKKDQDACQQFQTRIDQLTQDRDKQATLNAEQHAKLEAMRQTRKAEKITLKDISSENKLLTLQLHQVQEELESVFLQKQQLEQQKKKDQVALQEFQTRINQMTQALDEQAKVNIQQQERLKKIQKKQWLLEKANKAATQENELLLLQLHQVQEELENNFLIKMQLAQTTPKHKVTTDNEQTKELQRIKAQLLNKDRENKRRLQREMNLKRSVSWKITTPIRVIAKPFKYLSKKRITTRKQIKFLKACGLFDEAWYATVNADVVKSGYDPVEHYVLYGAAEGRDPSSTFSTRDYLERNPDVAEAGVNPLVHYAKYGIAEKRGFGKS